jgi:anti-sigma regulatory factor (Ser/Thr protein kinase)
MSDRIAELFLAANPEAPGQARRYVNETLSTWGRPDLGDQTALAVSELVTNAFLHGQGTITLTLRLSDVLRIAVYDSGPGQPAVRQYSSTATTGRGLHLVGSLTDRWGTTPDGQGKWVWFEVDVDSEDPKGSIRVQEQALQEATADREDCTGPLSSDGPAQALGRKAGPPTLQAIRQAA